MAKSDKNLVREIVEAARLDLQSGDDGLSEAVRVLREALHASWVEGDDAGRRDAEHNS